MSSSELRVRFAPSPTGMFHVGSARSALYNWVVAKQANGRFFLRIEDTDAARNKPEWIDGIVSAMSWLGMTPDQYDGPHFQSEFATEHSKAVSQLGADGHAYFCDCTRELVIARTGDVHKGYDGFCRDRGLAAGPGRALRFRTPDDGTTVITDLVRGTVEFDNRTIEDFVIARSDGTATFLLANVVDDLSMGITHVIRAEEHLSNTPKQQLLWAALGAAPPTWAHVSILVDEQRKKLSKRKHRVALEDFKDEGYLAAAMRNYLMLLGWSPSGDREIVPWSEVEAEFRLADVNASPAFFDVKKLRAFNGEYIRALSEADFIAACQPWLAPPVAPWPAERFDAAVFAELAPLAQTRIAVLSEIIPMVDFAFLSEPVHDPASWQKAIMTPVAPAILRDVLAEFRTATWEPATLKAVVEAVGVAHGLKLGKAQAPVRVAVTGRTIGLPLFESLAVVGQDATLARIEAAIRSVS